MQTCSSMEWCGEASRARVGLPTRSGDSMYLTALSNTADVRSVCGSQAAQQANLMCASQLQDLEEVSIGLHQAQGRR